MMNPKLRAMLLSEARNFADRAAYVAAFLQSPAWRDGEADRSEILGRIYDATHSTIHDILLRYGLSQSNFARYFGIPLRTVQCWYHGERSCPPYVLLMASELLEMDK